MVELLGFSAEERRLGEVAEFKSIREAVVAVPYIEKAGQRCFFEISRNEVDSALKGNADTPSSIKHMVEAMQRYVVPPKMDFIENPESVSPFAMYIFEFEHTLDKDDLVDIWQGIPPKIGQAFDSQSSDFKSGKGPHTRNIVKEVEISHPLVVGELLNNSDFPSKIRWMVFKIKQKAKKNYFDKVIKDRINANRAFDKGALAKLDRSVTSKADTVKYSYNWPYDFFSLVELVKLDAEVEISKDSFEEDNEQ